MSRKKVESLDVPAVPLNFLLTCTQKHLDEYELKILNDVANAREELIEVLDRLNTAMAQAGIVRWFRAKDRDEIRRDLETNDVLALAKEQIRAGQRGDDEIIPRPSLPPGSAHLAAALRYQKRNLQEGKCVVCPEPLAHNSHTFCEKHLREKRMRYKPQNAKGSKPGTVGYLYGEGFESQHGRMPGTVQSLANARQKKNRAILAELGLPLGTVATGLQAAKEKILEHVPYSENDGQENEAVTATELLGRAGLSGMRSTARKALQELVADGMVRHTGRKGRNKPLLYFRGGK